jgi:hypothetical protein
MFRSTWLRARMNRLIAVPWARGGNEGPARFVMVGASSALVIGRSPTQAH